MKRLDCLYPPTKEKLPFFTRIPYHGATMPRSTTSRRARAGRKPDSVLIDDIDPTTVIEEDYPVTTATATAPTETEEDTVRELPFTVDITPAPEDYKPDRSPAGRKRIPSDFEPHLPGLKGQGWQNQPHDGKVTVESNGKVSLPDGVKESNARIVLRELSKAVKYLNTEEGGEHNLGLDVNVTAENVQFNIRDKQNRKPRTAPGGGDVSDGESDDDSDNGDE